MTEELFARVPMREKLASTPNLRIVTSPNNNLPAATTRILGRERSIDLIQRQIGDARLVSIVGAGGIGKTTVAVAVAEQFICSFRDGVWLVDFAPLQEPSLVPNAIAAAIGLFVHSANVLAALCRFLRDRDILLVLDNCEHMLDTIAACTTQILQDAPNVRIIATSRAPLRVNGEQVHRLPGLATPSVSSGLTAEGAAAFPAIQLFVDRATDRLETFTLSDDDAPVVADLCKSLDGIALAIELAAMRVDAFGVRDLQKQLDDRFRLLGGRRAGLERHRTLAATLDWSYSLLPRGEAAMLRAVSVFAGAFRLDDASAVSNLAPDEAKDVLAELASKSLLSVDVDTEEATYRPLETTRTYCLEKLLASGEDSLIRLRHAEYMCTVLERAAGEWGQQLSREWGAAYGRYLDDLRAALAWVGADPTYRRVLIRLTAAGTLLWNHFSLTGESRTHLSRAISELQDAGSVGTAVEMHLQTALAGALIFTRGIVRETREAMRRALNISVQLSDTEARLRCLRMIGTCELFNGEHDAGNHTLETFVSIATAEDPSALADGETHLGCAELFLGRLRDSLRRVERLYDNSSQDFNDTRFARFEYSNSVNILIMLAHTHWLMGSPDTAERMAVKSVEYGRQAEHELSLSIALARACPVLFWLGRDEACSRHAAMLDDVVERHGIVTWRPIAAFYRGALASLRQDDSAGIDDLQRAVAECREIGHMARLPYYMAVLAEALGKHGRLWESEVTIHKALDMAAKHNEQWCLPELLRIQALILNRADVRETALLKSMAIADDIGARSWKLRTANDLAELWRSQSRTADAKRMLRPICDAFTEGFDTRDMTIATRFLGEQES